MIASNTQDLQKFILDNNLKREDGIILFHASIHLHNSVETLSFFSEIEVITLPKEMVLYILVFGGKENSGKEMYRTGQDQFKLLSQKELEISDTETNSRLVISLQPTAE